MLHFVGRSPLSSCISSAGSLPELLPELRPKNDRNRERNRLTWDPSPAGTVEAMPQLAGLWFKKVYKVSRRSDGGKTLWFKNAQYRNLIRGSELRQKAYIGGRF